MTNTQHAEVNDGTDSTLNSKPIMQARHIVDENVDYSAKEKYPEKETGQCAKETAPLRAPVGCTSRGNGGLTKTEGKNNYKDEGH